MNELAQGFNGIDLSVSRIMLNLVVSLLLAIALKIHFEKFSSAMSGKRELARVIPFLVLIVCLIISIVKSSLALSLGLVGALSIVRFRTPIKEPEELVYLFMAIGIGLGMGADQLVITVSATAIILLFVAALRWSDRAKSAKALYLHIEIPGDEAGSIDREEVLSLVQKHCFGADLTRADSGSHGFALTMRVDMPDTASALEMVSALESHLVGASIAMIDQSRIPGV